MTIDRKWITLAALAGFCVLAASAPAIAIPSDDATIVIDRALNSPTLTIRFAGVQAALVELRINGTSYGTRSVDATAKRGETTFTLDPSLLADGDNDVEVRLFDKAGRVVGTQKSVISADDGAKGPVFMVSPKVGASVLGAVEIKVGFGRELRNTYVSFFVNGQFKSMTNTAPYTFVWDTTREANGWHEVEAWVVDETSNTFKTRKVRVFVDNPGGRTNRVTRPVEPVAAASPAAGTPAAPKPVKANPSPSPVAAGGASPVAPAVAAGVPAANDVNAQATGGASLKPVSVESSVAMGSRSIAPNITRPNVAPAVVAKAAPATMEIKVSPKVTPAVKAAPVSIARGTRLPVAGPFSISLNAQPVVFDIQPRVQDGIPLTPFRALFEQAGGKVDWENLSKALTATGMGKEVFIRIGDRVAKVNKIDVDLEIAPFIERGRTIVPLSFIREGLDVDVQYDPSTGHVFITSKK